MLYVELNSASNGTTFKVGHRGKSPSCTPNTISRTLFGQYLVERFAVTLVLTFKPVVLYAELSSASNGTTFKVGHRGKSASCTPNTISRTLFGRYLVERFAVTLVLTFKPVVLYVELNSASNGTTFKVDHREEYDTSSRKPYPDTLFEGTHWHDSLYYLSYC